jgi:hypothetical protein
MLPDVFYIFYQAYFVHKHEPHEVLLKVNHHQHQFASMLFALMALIFYDRMQTKNLQTLKKYLYYYS